jgi:nucleoid-associated protein YgaU
MPNDAKLGLFFGMGLVIVVAVLFFRRDLPGVNLAAGNSPVWSLQSKLTADSKNATTGRTVGGRRHVVKEGDTLMNLAQKYYGDKDRFSTILDANRDQLNAPDRLTPGTILVIPDVPAKK